MHPQEITSLNVETTTIEWELWSPHFEDIFIIGIQTASPSLHYMKKSDQNKYTKDTSKQDASRLNRQQQEEQYDQLEI